MSEPEWTQILLALLSPKIVEPHWIQIVAALSSVLLTPTIAGFGIYFAWWQSQIAQNKLKLDLFEKRLVVYYATSAFIGSIMMSGTSENEEMSKFISSKRTAKWLFNDDIAAYLSSQA